MTKCENYYLRLEGKKRCSKCKTIKDLDLFSIKSTNRINQESGRCKVCDKEYGRLHREQIRNNPRQYCHMLSVQIKHRAKELQLKFNIDKEYLYKLWVDQEGLCYYTHEKMDLLAVTSKRQNPHIDYPSIDRLIPKDGYIKNNIVWCKWGVNRMKNNLTKEQFLLFCKKVILNHS